MALKQFTRREVVAAIPLVLAAPTLLRAQPAPEKVWRFLVIGDWGRDGREDQRRTALAMEQVAREKRTECVISTSDNFYHWGVWSDTDYRWKCCFENVYSPDLGNWYSVLGTTITAARSRPRLAAMRSARAGTWMPGGTTR